MVVNVDEQGRDLRLSDFGAVGVDLISFQTVNGRVLVLADGKLRFPVYGLGMQESLLWAIS